MQIFDDAQMSICSGFGMLWYACWFRGIAPAQGGRGMSEQHWSRDQREEAKSKEGRNGMGERRA